MRFVLIVRRYFELFLNFALLLCFALNCAIMIDMFSSIFYQNSKPLVSVKCVCLCLEKM